MPWHQHRPGCSPGPYKLCRIIKIAIVMASMHARMTTYTLFEPAEFLVPSLKGGAEKTKKNKKIRNGASSISGGQDQKILQRPLPSWVAGSNHRCGWWLGTGQQINTSRKWRFVIGPSEECPPPQPPSPPQALFCPTCAAEDAKVPFPCLPRDTAAAVARAPHHVHGTWCNAPRVVGGAHVGRCGRH